MTGPSSKHKDTIIKGKLLTDKPINTVEEDGLRYKDYVAILNNLVTTCETPMTVGIHGEWGSGKTSLMQMLADQLRRQGLTTVWFNAWKYDREDIALWRALVLQTLDALRPRNEEGNVVQLHDLGPDKQKVVTELDRLEESIYRTVEWQEVGKWTVDWAKALQGTTEGAAEIALSFVPGASALVDLLKQARQSTSGDLSPIAQAFRREVQEFRREQLRSVEQFVNNFEDLLRLPHAIPSDRLVVFVDDLDRCVPGKVIDVLEAIKLFLDAKKCVFVVGCDRNVVQQALIHKYGSELEPVMQNYVEKIIQFSFDLPPLQDKDIQLYAAKLGLPDDISDYFSTVIIGVENNPRTIKRLLNSIWWHVSLDQQRRLGLNPRLLAKCVCITYRWPQLWNEALLNQTLLSQLEAFALIDPKERTEHQEETIQGSPTLSEYLADQILRTFLRLEPYFRDNEFSEYLYLKPFESEIEDSEQVNPYFAGVTVAGRSLTGRDDVFSFIQNTFATQDGRFIVLYGEPFMGKTSILVGQLTRIRPLFSLRGDCQIPVQAVQRAGIWQSLASRIELR